MWMREYLMEVKTSAEKIWKIWTDVENWREWAGGEIESSTINGKFENGTFGITKLINNSQSTFCLKDVVVNKSFTSQSKLPFCTVDFVHELKNNDNGLTIKLGVRINGPLTCILKNIVGKKVAANLPIMAKKLAEMVKN